jgi:2-dehydropantoate 2-reductase
VETFTPEDAYDLVIVLVRKNQVASVLLALAANKSTPSFLFMINNAAGPDEYISAVGRSVFCLASRARAANAMVTLCAM